MVGQCLCGAVRFSITPPSTECAHCHCTMCRRAHGAAFVTWLVVPAGQFTVTAGEDALRWFGSSAQARRGFCGQCGSTMLFESTLCPGEVHVTLASLVTPADRGPELHCFVDAAVDWVRMADELRRLDSESEELTHYRAVRPAPRAR